MLKYHPICSPSQIQPNNAASTGVVSSPKEKLELLYVYTLFGGATRVMIRMYKGIPFRQASPEHFAQALCAKWWSTKIILYGILSIRFFSGRNKPKPLARLLPASCLSFPFLVLVVSWYIAPLRRKGRSYNMKSP